MSNVLGRKGGVDYILEKSFSLQFSVLEDIAYRPTTTPNTIHQPAERKKTIHSHVHTTIMNE